MLFGFPDRLESAVRYAENLIQVLGYHDEPREFRFGKPRRVGFYKLITSVLDVLDESQCFRGEG